MCIWYRNALRPFLWVTESCQEGRAHCNAHLSSQLAWAVHSLWRMWNTGKRWISYTLRLLVDVLVGRFLKPRIEVFQWKCLVQEVTSCGVTTRRKCISGIIKMRMRWSPFSHTCYVHLQLTGEEFWQLSITKFKVEIATQFRYSLHSKEPGTWCNLKSWQKQG